MFNYDDKHNCIIEMKEETVEEINTVGAEKAKDAVTKCAENCEKLRLARFKNRLLCIQETTDSADSREISKLHVENTKTSKEEYEEKEEEIDDDKIEKDHEFYESREFQENGKYKF